MDYDDFRHRLGKRITMLRLEKDIKQELLAELIDKSKEFVSFLERGLRSPSFETLIDLASALGIPLSSLLDLESDKQEDTDLIPAPLSPDSLPDMVENPIKPIEQRKSDIERLQEGLEGVRSLQRLAHEYDIADIFQDNGGKVLQLLILLGLKQSKGREGNDAVDEEGNEYELKTINLTLNPNAGITTHHHLTKEIIEKYRAVTWYIGLYEGIELMEIWKVHPSELEELFKAWDKWIDDHGGQSRNNPKIRLRYVRRGERVYRNPLKPDSDEYSQPGLLDLESLE